MAEQDQNTADAPRGPSVHQIPEGDSRQRLVCPDCGYIQYDNPKIIVGAVCTWQDRYLMCRRAIPPREGYWTMPAGFMEMAETTADGAAREVWEEARARVEMGELLGIYEIPHISQVYMIYTARMTGPEHAPGEESLETALMTWDEIPWDHLAFPSVRHALSWHRDGGGPHRMTAPPMGGRKG